MVSIPRPPAPTLFSEHHPLRRRGRVRPGARARAAVLMTVLTFFALHRLYGILLSL